MSNASDLVTMAMVKSWLSLPDVTKDDAALAMLITQISTNIVNYINRSAILPRTFVETVNGRGKSEMLLRNYPVYAVTALQVNGTTTPASQTMTDTGFFLEPPDDTPPGSPQNLYMRGTYFHQGFQNVVVTYVAGYQVPAEAAVAATSVTTKQFFGAWGSDLGVKFTGSGVPLTAVTGTPSTGQYSVSSAGVYTFAAADVGLPVTIAYGYIPHDLAQAALEWIAERWSYRSRVGMQSKSLGGQETTSFAITRMPQFIMTILHQYMSVATF
jgi:hypothetical protein